MVRGAFSQRRKTAVNSISSAMGIPKAEIIEALQKSELSETVRAEKLTMDDLARLFENLFAEA